MGETFHNARKVLFIGAHPDDIEWYCGGLVYLLRQRDVEVIFTIATKGGKGKRGPFRRWLEARRGRDQIAAADILGGAEIIMFDHPDKSLSQHTREFAIDIKGLIELEKPDVIFSWDPDYIYNPHPDHQAAADSLRLAINDISPGVRICYYGTRNPDVSVGYDEDVFAIKLKAIQAHGTEFFSRLPFLAKRILIDRTHEEGRKVGSDYAEVFRCENYTPAQTD